MPAPFVPSYSSFPLSPAYLYGDGLTIICHLGPIISKKPCCFSLQQSVLTCRVQAMQQQLWQVTQLPTS